MSPKFSGEVHWSQLKGHWVEFIDKDDKSRMGRVLKVNGKKRMISVVVSTKLFGFRKKKGRQKGKLTVKADKVRWVITCKRYKEINRGLDRMPSWTDALNVKVRSVKIMEKRTIDGKDHLVVKLDSGQEKVSDKTCPICHLPKLFDDDIYNSELNMDGEVVESGANEETLSICFDCGKKEADTKADDERKAKDAERRDAEAEKKKQKAKAKAKKKSDAKQNGDTPTGRVAWNDEKDKWLLNHGPDGYPKPELTELAETFNEKFSEIGTYNSVRNRLFRLRKKIEKASEPEDNFPLTGPATDAVKRSE